jgi:hypothetical protein
MTEIQERDRRNELQHEDKLDLVRKDMINALELFFSHTKYAITLLTAILAASLGVAAFSFDKLKDFPDASKAAMIVAALFLLLMGPVSYISYRLVDRYYRLYVSCYIYAARMHWKHSPTPHPWFVLFSRKDLEQSEGGAQNYREITPEELNKQDIVSGVIKDEIVNFPKDGGKNSWFLYRLLLLILGAFGTCAGIFLLGWLLARP